MLRRYVLRSKVELKNVSEEYDVWASWGSEREQVWESPRKWTWANSGVVEPAWDHTDEWPWGVQDLILRDRRAVGMGRRMLIKKGDLRESDHFTLENIDECFRQRRKHPLMTLPIPILTLCIVSYMACPRVCRTFSQCRPTQWNPTWTSWAGVSIHFIHVCGRMLKPTSGSTSRLQEMLLCRPRIDCPNLPYWCHQEANSPCSNSQTR